MIGFSLTIKAILTKTVPCVRKVHAVDKLNNRLTRIRDGHSPTFRYQHGIPAHAVVAQTCTVRRQELRRLLSRVSASRLQYVQSSWIAPGALDKPSFELNASHASLPSCVERAVRSPQWHQSLISSVSGMSGPFGEHGHSRAYMSMLRPSFLRRGSALKSETYIPGDALVSYCLG
jgi:hypothetical protein